MIASPLTQPLRICHVFAGVEGGSWAFDQLLSLKNDFGCEVTAVLSGSEGPLPDRCRAAGIPIKPLDFRMSPGTMTTLPWRIFSFALWLRRNRIDVVQSHVVNSTMLARPAAWLADVPVRLTMVTSPYYMDSPTLRQVEIESCSMETGIIPSCVRTADLYREAGVAEELICETLYYGPSSQRFDPAKAQPLGLRQRLGLPADAPTIASIAHFYPRMPRIKDIMPACLEGQLLKGHDVLIDAMPHILSEFPDAKMLFIGKGWGLDPSSCEAEIRALIAQAGMGDHVFMAGYIDDIPGAYMDVDVSVQASLYENLGGTIESLLMQRPTVATRVGGMIDSVIDGETGILVNPSDATDLARGICELLRDRERARLLGEQGRKRMLEGFTLEATMPRLAALYSRQRAAAPTAWRSTAFTHRLFSLALRYLPVTASVGKAVFRRFTPAIKLRLKIRGQQMLMVFFRAVPFIPAPIRRRLSPLKRLSSRLFKS